MYNFSPFSVKIYIRIYTILEVARGQMLNPRGRKGTLSGPYIPAPTFPVSYPPPPPTRKFTKIYDFWWSQGGGPPFHKRMCIWGTINSQFQSALFCQNLYVYIRFWRLQGVKPLCIRKFCIGELNLHTNFRPLFWAFLSLEFIRI